MASKKVITQYIGPLTVEQAAEGISRALTNARALIQDAELLLEHSRWPRAAALAILAIEEAGKVALVRALLLTHSESELRDEWRSYRSHTKKNVLWILPQLAREGARFLEDLRPTMDEQTDHSQVLEAIKQIALYTDAYGRCKWSLPSKAISEQFARSMVSLAGLLAKGDEGLTTVDELRPLGEVPRAGMERPHVGNESGSRGLLQGGRGNRSPQGRLVREGHDEIPLRDRIERSPRAAGTAPGLALQEERMSLMRLAGKRGPVVALTCSVLAFATSASAECAWVLWLEKSEGGRVTIPLGPRSAYRMKEECETNIDEQAKAMEAMISQSTDPSYSTMRAGGTIYLLKDRVFAVRWDYTCFPDTVDPRGPKGGQR